jgi:hypothetical protein
MSLWFGAWRRRRGAPHGGGDLLGGVAMLRLRSLPEAARIAQGKR